MRFKSAIVTILAIATSLALTACVGQKKNDQPPATPGNQQTVAELPTVALKPININDPATFPPQNFISLNGSDGQKIGDAYRSYQQNKFTIKVAVTLPNGSYSAYLVNPSSKKFIPLGTLTSKEGKWVTPDYSSDRDGKDFTHLVIVSGQNITDPDKGQSVASGDFHN